ncbi:MAG: hypothetical protein KKG73_03375, partial [Gammaproteobacteria bacterium]|nr:hypothetical protein [Gammaproteobacteria bacterium]
MKRVNSLSFSDWRGLHHRVPALNSTSPYRYGRVYGVMVLAFGLFALAASAGGELKTWIEIDWLDVAGEGLVVIAALSWLHFLLQWRPPGPYGVSAQNSPGCHVPPPLVQVSRVTSAQSPFA